MLNMVATISETDTWRDQAACLGVDSNLFFLEKGYAREVPARLICDTCPVTQNCLDYALDTSQQFGIWGGMTLKQRQAWARRNR